MKKEDILKTLDILALAALAGSWLFKLPALAAVAAALLLLNVIGGKPAELIARGWMAFGRLLGAVNSRVLLTLVFYLFLTPLSLLYRRFNRKSADRFRKDTSDSLFTGTPQEYSREMFEKLW